ncbi:glycosyltransferase family 2 protein [Flexibacterium corallicola]|uniref:glycosyltransferase family 2 protein n=1 Tax=Flexibacterium corallicola TaxID=3037259 RepID=UPI00286EC3B7|nr:glycosyltransferase [Pseudovibrio sp. M1P-2-3]
MARQALIRRFVSNTVLSIFRRRSFSILEQKFHPESFHFGIERCSINSLTYINGWAFFLDSQIISVDLVPLYKGEEDIDHIVRLDKLERRDDIGEHFNNAYASLSGFRFILEDHGQQQINVEICFHSSAGQSSRIRLRLYRDPFLTPKAIFANTQIISIKNLKSATKMLFMGNWKGIRKYILEQAFSEKGEELLSLDRIAEVELSSHNNCNTVAIIVPIYNGSQYLEKLFESLHKNTVGKFKLIVINDGSSDPLVSKILNLHLKNFEDCKFIDRYENRGFVSTVNEASKYADGDFIVLNTDVVVPPNWLERLMAPLYNDARVASITPFSNSATILSFPDFPKDSEMYNGYSVKEIDEAFQKIGFAKSPDEIPTGVGFCMAINGRVWRTIGGFDEETFGLGYGEENDWCQRAIAHGYRNVIARNLFVQHDHGGSFGPKKKALLLKQNLIKLNAKHSGYDNSVKEFIAQDSLKVYRAIAKYLLDFRENNLTLIVDHNVGGGANVFREKLISDLIASNGAVALVYPANKQDKVIIELLTSVSDKNIFTVSLQNFLYVFSSVLEPKKIFFNNAYSYSDPLKIAKILGELQSRSGADFSVAYHDFYTLCPSQTLIGHDGRFCDLPAQSVCHKCIPKNIYANNPQHNAINKWRDIWGHLLRKASKITCYSNDSREHLLSIFPELSDAVVVQPHKLPAKFNKIPKVMVTGQLTIGVIGAIGYQKGSEVVKGLVDYIQKNEINAEIVVLGVLNGGKASRALRIHGRYKTEDLPDLVEKYSVDVCLMPSIWPETFSYVTEEIMTMKMPIVAFDIGAPAERVKSYHKGRLLSLSHANEYGMIFDTIKGAHMTLVNTKGKH